MKIETSSLVSPSRNILPLLMYYSLEFAHSWSQGTWFPLFSICYSPCSLFLLYDRIVFHLRWNGLFLKNCKGLMNWLRASSRRLQTRDQFRGRFLCYVGFFSNSLSLRIIFFRFVAIIIHSYKPRWIFFIEMEIDHFQIDSL